MKPLVVDHVCRAAFGPVSFAADLGEVVGVVGRAGVGKTTLLQLIAGQVTATAGEIVVHGSSVFTRLGRRAVGYAGDPSLLPAELTGVEWLKHLASHRAANPVERGAMLQAAVQLADVGAFVGRRLGAYSREMILRLSIAGAAVLGRKVVLLDEMLRGLDPIAVKAFREVINRIARHKRVVVIASNDLATIERIATRVLVLHKGTLKADTNIALLARERIAELSLTGSGLHGADRLIERFPGSIRIGEGVAVPLIRGLTIEAVLSTCRSERIPVSASRVRYRALEDLFAD